MWLFSYPAFWLTGQWRGALAPPPPSPGYATGDCIVLGECLTRVPYCAQ